MQRLVMRLPGGEPGRHVAVLVTGTGLAQVLVMAFIPLLTRLYPPAAYGAFAAAASVVSILISISCLRYEFAVTLPETDAEAANVLALAVLINLVLSALVALAMAIGGAPMLAAIGAAALSPFAWLLALGQVGGGVASALVNWAIRTRTFGEIAAARVTQAVGMIVVQVSLGVAGLGAVGLLLGDIVGRVSGSGRLAASAWRGHASAIRSVSRRGLADAARRYRRFPLLSSPSALLSVVAMQAPLLAVVALYGADAGGQFAIADRVSSVPLTLVAGAVGQVYLGEIARRTREHVGDLRAPFIGTTRRLAGIAIGPAALIAILAPLLAGPVLGAEWAQTGVFVAILAPMYYLLFVATATGDTLYVLERQDLQLMREVLRAILLGGAVPIAAALDLDVTAAVVALSAAGCATYLAYAAITWLAIVRQPASIAVSGPGAPGRTPTGGRGAAR